MPTPELRDEGEAKTRIAMYYANLAQMDTALGQVTAALRELDLEQDTIVVYTTDHGEMLGDHGLWQKSQFYEGSCSVPLIVRAPAVTRRNASCQVPVSQVQVLPALGELCGIAVPKLDGPSLFPQFRNPAAISDQPVYAEFNLQNTRAKYMLRQGDYKYTFWANDIPNSTICAPIPTRCTTSPCSLSKSKVEELKAQLFAWYNPPEIRK